MGTEPLATRPAGPPAVLGGRYELSEVIGTGGMAEVRRARDLRLGRDVAVKLLSQQAVSDDSRRRRIEREARALAALEHANVVAVFDYGSERVDGVGVIPYVVMELVDGPDLETHLRSRDLVDPAEAAELLGGVLAAVGAAHAAGIVHGDLKPANVLVSDHGVKVADFGVARILGEETGATTVAATPSYAAPEVLRGARPTEASDVYSVGCLGFRILVGRPPFEGDGAWDVAAKHVEAPVPSARTLRPEVPESFDRAVQRAMAKDPRQRFSSPAAFADALLASIETSEQQPTTPMPAGPVPAAAEPTEVLAVPRPRRSPWRSRVVGSMLAAAGALVLVLSLTGLRGNAVTVPDVRGRTVAEAASRLREAGLVPTGVSYLEATGGGDTVVRTFPGAGEDAARGTEVHIVAAMASPTPAPAATDEDKDEKDEGGKGNRGRGRDD